MTSCSQNRDLEPYSIFLEQASFLLNRKMKKLQIRLWLGGKEENSQVQSCCCSPKRLATKMQRDFPDTWKWEQERKTRQPYDIQITHWKLQHLVSWTAEDTKRVSKDTQRDPGTRSCSSLGPASTLTQLSQGLDQESHQAADSLAKNNPSFDRVCHRAAPQWA